MKKVLTIAGSDCSGGAGIQADIKTIMAHKMYGMSVITSLTAQNTRRVYHTLDISPEFVEQQLDAVFTDIVPDSVKIGMVSNNEIIKVIAKKLIKYNVNNIVLDPVMISSSGKKLLHDDAMEILTACLVPLVRIITPNIPEAIKLSGVKIHTKEDMQKSAIKIAKNYNGKILIKGGHLKSTSDDLFYSNGEFFWFNQERIDNPNTHGTGCTLSTAIACNLAEKTDEIECIANAKRYVTGALKSGLNLGEKSGPLNHCWN